MNIIKKMRWGNAFSYGPDNEIDFTASPITQLVGSNGHGKSSIALILEECLYNKNSKGVKKADILNRYSGKTKYWIEVTFEVDGQEYVVFTERSPSTQSVKLSAGGVDISSHTSTATYKQVENLLKIDHKTFAQLVYQSHAGSLEFLTATDSLRKKFLTELLGLDRYAELGDKFKSLASSAGKEVDKVQASIDVLLAWVTRYQDQPLEKRALLPTIEDKTEAISKQLGKLEHELSNIADTNKRISDNAILRKKLSVLLVPDRPVEPQVRKFIDVEPLRNKKALIESEKSSAVTFCRKMAGLRGTCPTCMTKIDEHTVDSLKLEKEATIEGLDKELAVVTAELQEAEAYNADINKVLAAYTAAISIYNAADNKRTALKAAIVQNLPETELTETEITETAKSLRMELDAHRSELKRIVTHNNEVEVHNAKVQSILETISERMAEIERLKTDLSRAQKTAFSLSMLAKAFSGNGLIAYKIESLIQDLEDITNEYLCDLSDGRFVISFVVSASDKLNVVINDNGNSIDIASLSGGERARVNVATLLAIRRLMQSLSGSRLNLLILDETIEAMDQFGKEKLIEVLLKQDHLNTYIVSHGFTHPLLDKVVVVKEDNQSRLER